MFEINKVTLKIEWIIQSFFRHDKNYQQKEYDKSKKILRCHKHLSSALFVISRSNPAVVSGNMHDFVMRNKYPKFTFDNTEESEPLVSQHQTGVKDKETHENKVAKY